MSSPIRTAAREQARSSLDKLKELESKVENQSNTIVHVIKVTDQALQRLQSDLDTLKETVNALITLAGDEVPGADLVEATIVENRKVVAEENATLVKGNIAKGVTDGKLKPAEMIAETSLITGHEVLPDGSVMHPGYVAIEAVQIEEAVRAQLIGQAPGFSLDFPNGNKFVVDEVYERVPLAVVPNEGQADQQ